MLSFLTERRWGRALICAACIYHMAGMVSANLGFNTAFGGELRRPFTYYIGYVGLWQNWVMFHTIPHFRAIRPMLVAKHGDGTQTEHGAMLPGLTPYEHRTRLASLFFRYTWPTPDIDPYARGYLRRACEAVTQASGKKPKTVTLRLDSYRLNTLVEARNTRKTGKPAQDFSTLSMPCE